MTRFTESYGSFIERKREVVILANSAARQLKLEVREEQFEANAMCRGAVVLLSSHLEAYIKELGELVIDRIYERKVGREKIPVQFYFHISKEKIEAIFDSRDPQKIAAKMFDFIGSEINHWSRDGNFPVQIPASDFNKGFANPAFDKIKKYFNRFGFEGFEAAFKRKQKGNSLIVINTINHLVETRNNIAHGDPLATKTPVKVKDLVDKVTIFCRTTDEIFANWCATEYCAIR
ncbi:MAG: hypothetical protein IPL47_15910 [Phyllobacteriaceae bacterium]|nr:hypothetical protein [Phyllobacteriaceae bacterium]